MKDILDIERLDARLGYKLTMNDKATGAPKEIASFRFIADKWQMRVGSGGFREVHSAWALPENLRTWRNEHGCQLQFWACCFCSTDDQKELQKELFRRGAQITHGVCQPCSEKMMAEVRNS